MFFNKKKKLERAAQASENNRYMYNLDGMPFFDCHTGEFLMLYRKELDASNPVAYEIMSRDCQFDSDQKKILRLLIDYKFPVGALAYVGLPAEYIVEVQKYFMPEIDGEYHYYPFKEEELYKITHTDLDLNQFAACLIGLRNEVYMCDEIEDISEYPSKVLALVAKASTYGMNLCSMVKPDMDMEKFVKDVEYRINHAKTKAKLLNKFSDFSEHIAE